MGLHRCSYHPCDISVGDFLVKKMIDRHLVRGGEHCRHAASRPERIKCKGKTGEALSIRLFERQRAYAREIKSGRRPLEPLGVGERIGYRTPHVRHAELS